MKSYTYTRSVKLNEPDKEKVLVFETRILFLKTYNSFPITHIDSTKIR